VCGAVWVVPFVLLSWIAVAWPWSLIDGEWGAGEAWCGPVLRGLMCVHTAPHFCVCPPPPPKWAQVSSMYCGLTVS
jgi:hypothetical protein